MKFLDASLQVLDGSERPMTTDEIAEVILERRYLTSSGKTPSATVAAALYVAVRDGRAPGLERVFEPGSRRARRGTVRWRYRRP
ncbi:MAG: winged helix-turn-helix domain-containing protein [Chloroflexi bacterium]|nr:winged helix-turn-helix domain-containing protein [Chloroflexota bacterium]